MKTIGVIGCGVVGGAVARGFKERGLKVFTFDRYKKGHDDIPQIYSADVIFVCVPTPSNEDGTQDLTALEDVFAMLKGAKFGGTICIKSTVVVGTTESLAKKFGFRKVCHNPEFLTAARPYQDFMEQTSILIGGEIESALEVGDVYHEARFSGIHIVKDAKLTEKAKYMRNNYLATKVSFFNEQAELCQLDGIAYAQALALMLSVGGIEESHTRVPGPDASVGFGGMCFPKDSKAECRHGKDLGHPMEMLTATIESNKRRREA